MPSTHQVLGRTVSMPVRVRHASAVTAMFSVHHGAAQRLVDYAGLRVLRHRRDRAVLALLHVRYVDGDLGAYDELGVAVLVEPHDGPTPPGRWDDLRALVSRRAGLLIHRLPVDGEFTMAAGREIWGFPKELADFAVTEQAGGRRVVLRQDGRTAVDLTVRPGLRLPLPTVRSAMRAYTCLDGVTRVTEWTMDAGRIRSRPGGARVVLGDHPIADELAGLGLPRGALLSTSIGRLRMSFADARPVG